MDKKAAFKQIIKEFHEKKLPETYSRELKIADTRKIVSIIGSRRSGKTFYFYELIKGIRKNADVSQTLYINFEDDRIMPLELSDLNYTIEAYFELYPENMGKTLYFFFDEIQNITGWEIFVRRIHDTTDTRIFVTGSSSKLLSKEIATSLRGRTIPFYLYPLGFGEYLHFKGIDLEKDWEYGKKRYPVKKMFGEYMRWGGFPEIALEDETLSQNILKNYYEMFIYRDLMERFSIRNINLLKGLAAYLLTNISNLFSVNSYYRSVKENTQVSKETVAEYVSHLEDIGLIWQVPFFSHSLKSQQVNPRKIYCIDQGLRGAVAFQFSKDTGRLAENITFIELKRRNYDVYYWKGKKEVDFIARSEDGKLQAINVSYTNDINPRETEGLHEFSKINDAELILLTEDIEKEEDGISFVPLWKWLLR
ncbi:ATP-binding protein [uncultured Methanolobus sp.]|uniref:ATP-binding protein n=1 Tax=uncultured Methanolobus sp. TaxID=218300 RepID=UPI0029C76CCF|nr:ATP-binding protein [uncultured Methanolobus sp.]